MTTTASIKAPAHLGARGRRLWRRIMEDFEPAESGREILLEAVRVVDRCESLEQALRGEPLTTTGSRGQIVAHPLLAELRSERLLLSRLLAQLDVPEEGEGAGTDWNTLSSSQRARKAARARWDRR